MKFNLKIVVTAAALAVTPMQGYAADVSLRVANWIANPKHPISVALNAWAEKVEAESDGRIDVEVDTARIGKPGGQYDLVAKGVVDIGWGLLSLTPGRFELSQVIELPFMSPNGEAGSRMATEVYQKHFKDVEFTDTKLLAIHVHGPGQLHTKTKVSEIADLTGQKIRTVGGGVKWVEALGATPVVMPASQSHEALARGVADGILFPWQAIQAYKLKELVPYHLEIQNGLYTVAFFFNMNEKAYASLPDDLKSVIDANSGPDTAAFFGKAWDDADERSRVALAADDTQTIEAASPAVYEELLKRSTVIIDGWKKLAASKGVDGEMILDELKK